MMNIATQICGLAILIVIKVIHHHLPKVNFNSSKVFGLAIWADIACLVLDIGSLYAIKYERAYVSPVITDLSARLYLLSLDLITYLGFVYICALVAYSGHTITMIWTVRFYTLILLAAIPFEMLLPIHYYCKGYIIYSYGPACLAAYVFAPFFVISTLIATAVQRKHLPGNIFSIVCVWVGAEIAAAFIQFFVTGALIVGFASSVGLLIIYLEIENPAFQTDRHTGTFNIETLSRYVKELYRHKVEFSYIVVKLICDVAPAFDTDDEMVLEASGLMTGIRDSMTFYAGQGTYMLIFPDADKAKEGASMLKGSLTNLFRVSSMSFVEVYEPHGRQAGGLGEMLEVADHLIASGEYTRKDIITARPDDYKRYRRSRLIIKEIDDALNDDRLEAFFQPIYCVNKDSFVAAEALARIRRPDGSLLPPSVFIPISEKTGQVKRIGDRMFEKTVQLIRDRGLKDLGVDFIDVNLSVLQCEDETMAQRYLAIMREANVDPHMFCFEITESAMIVDRKTILTNLNALLSAGSTCSLDDFGNGESNLNYVVDMPISLIKADRHMVTRYRSNHRVTLIMDSMIHMAKGLSLKIVAEGVETKDELDAMKALAIDYIQGYYFSKPLPADDYVSFLTRKNKAV